MKRPLSEEHIHQYTFMIMSGCPWSLVCDFGKSPDLCWGVTMWWYVTIFDDVWHRVAEIPEQ